MPGTSRYPTIQLLRESLDRGAQILQKQPVPLGSLAIWSGGVRYYLERIYGKDSLLLSHLPRREIDPSITDPQAELVKRMEALRRIIDALEKAPQSAIDDRQ
jgi:hypothetical protein